MELLRRFSFTLLLMTLTTLVACGGGDGGLSREGGDGGTGTAGDIVTVTLAITDQNLSEQVPVIISASVTQGGVAFPGQLVTFSLDTTEIAFFTPEIGTAITDADGIATIQLNAGGTGGAGLVTVSVDSADPKTIGFTSAGDGNSGGVPTVSSIGLFASSQQLASSGLDTITLTAIAKDKNNNLLENIKVSFTASSGNIEVVKAVTGPDGKASAKLTTENAPANRVIDIKASSDLVEDIVSVQVVGTSITLTGSSSLAIGDANDYIIKVLDSDGKGIAKTTVALSVTNISTELPAGDVSSITILESVLTDFEGQATLSVTGTTGGTNTIIADAFGASANQAVAVQADSFFFSSFSNGSSTVDPSTGVIPDVLLSKSAEVTLLWTRSGVVVKDDTKVNFTTTRGSLSSSTATTVNGKVTVMVTSIDAGKALITFIGNDEVGGQNIELSNQLEFEFVADTAATVKAQASPKSIGPNGQTSTIFIIVKDVNGNLVKGKDIDFELTDISGGSIFPASATTDSSGSASTVYTSQTTSAQDAVSITATVKETPDVKDLVTLTVSDRELFIALGTGNKVEVLGSTDYIKEYSVFVTDADSNPVKNVELTISAIPETYYKGFWMQTYEGDKFISWVVAGEGSISKPLSINDLKDCSNEDLNLDGILDVDEDVNGNGKLTPGNVVAADGSITTDADGRGVIKIRYGQSYANFVDIKLIASSKVSGTESSAQTIFTLPVLSEHVLNENVSPPTQGIGTTGPFGDVFNCSNPE
jgi:hypothetical protein